MAPQIRTDIAIAGGGAAGLALALLLDSAGIPCSVIEPKPPLTVKETPANGRTVALMNSSLNVVKLCGVLEDLQDCSSPLEVMRIIDCSLTDQAPLTSDFDAFDLGLDAYGRNIPNAMLRAALFEKAKGAQHITLHAPATLESFEVKHDHVHLTLSTGDALVTPLLVGADGRNSMVRNAAGIGLRKHQYGQTAMTFLIHHSQCHNNTATEFHRPSGPLALVPLPGNISSVVWVETTGRAQDILSHDTDQQQAIFQDIIGDTLGAITLASDIEGWPLCALTARHLVAPHIALIAEAAHTMSPITAQGLNLSLRDVATLAETLVDAARLGQPFGSEHVLNTYERRRKPDIETRTRGVDTMMRLVSSDNALIKQARRKGLEILDKFSPAKTIAMRHGLAPALDQGRILRGETL